MKWMTENVHRKGEERNLCKTFIKYQILSVYSNEFRLSLHIKAEEENKSVPSSVLHPSFVQIVKNQNRAK